MEVLPPGRTTQLDLSVERAAPSAQIVGDVAIEVTGGSESATFSRPLRLAFSLRALKPVVVDGELSEWSSDGLFALDRKDQLQIGRSRWNGPEDLSATVRSRWDDKAIYLAVDVTDEFLERNSAAMQLWNGTSVEVFVDTNHREDLGKAMYDKDDFQFLFGPATKGFPEDLWGIAPHSGKSHLPGLVMKSKETARGYAMEIALPREMFEMELLPGALRADYGAGMSMGLSIVANDRAEEKPGRKSGIIWGGTPRNHLDPTKFGTLILLP